MLYRNNKGFTLIELMVVLVIVGIMLALMIPNVAGFVANQEVNEAAQNVAGALRNAKEIAISKNVRTVVEVDNTTRTIVIYRQPMQNEVLVGNTIDSSGVTCYQIDSRPIFALKNSVGLQTMAGTAPDSGALLAHTYIKVGFLPAGRATFFNASGDQTIYLQPDKEYKNGNGTTKQMRAITVSTTTGRARIYQWGGTSWQ